MKKELRLPYSNLIVKMIGQYSTYLSSLQCTGWNGPYLKGPLDCDTLWFFHLSFLAALISLDKTNNIDVTHWPSLVQLEHNHQQRAVYRECA